MPLWTNPETGHTVLHCHIPKCGGTSLTRWALDNGMEVTNFATNNCDFPDHRPNSERRPLQHATRYVSCAWDYDEAFAVVRDPVERMRSELVKRAVHETDAYQWVVRQFEEHRAIMHTLTPGNRAASELIHGGWPAKYGMHIVPQTDFVPGGAIVMEYSEVFNGREDAISFLHYFGGSARTIPHLRKATATKYDLPAAAVREVKRFYAADYERFEFDD